jgi:zinc/manganese transport system substrate-binding protein
MRIILSSVGIGRGVGIAIAATLVLGACSTGRAARTGVRVVAAENFWGSITAQIAGPDASVTSIVTQPDADPHDYEPTPSDARAFADARLVVENGVGYDPWAQRLLDADSGHGRVVLDVGKLLDVPDGGNPHRWYSRADVGTFIKQVTADLERVDPARRAGYARRAHDLTTRGFAALDGWIARIKQRFADAPIGASESIVSVWADTLGLKLRTPESFVAAVSEGNEPTAADKATVDAQIEHHQIKVFVYNEQNATPDVRRLVDAAHLAHIPVVTITETLTPATARFQDWQSRELRDLYQALVEASR